MSYSLMILDHQDNQVFECHVGSAWATSYHWGLLAPNKTIRFIDKLFEIAENEEESFLSGENLIEFQTDLKTIINESLVNYSYGENYKYDILIDLAEFLETHKNEIRNYRLYFF